MIAHSLKNPTTDTEIPVCAHCGELCNDENHVVADGKHFCCSGCKTVYEILATHNMCQYYDLSDKPGVSLNGKYLGDRFAYLDNAEIQQKLLNYADNNLCKATFYIPAINCSSCIWLLENLYKLQDGVNQCAVNFVKKEYAVSYNPNRVSLRQLVELLATLGYEPHISLEDFEHNTRKQNSRSLVQKIAVTGFCTGNIMLLSFPEYFKLDSLAEGQYLWLFRLLNIALILPVFFYGASGYFKSAYQSLRKKVINIDVPLSIGIFTLFARSLYEVSTNAGSGYWDSLSGLVFFLLVGKWFQSKTYENLSFERDYKSYFPLAATVIKGQKTESLPVAELQQNDRLLIHNRELIPADSLLLSAKAWIDYSFVTGEDKPVEKTAGEYIYAGGRQIGSNIEVLVQKPVSQSYLTQLWNSPVFDKTKEKPVTKLSAAFSKYFTISTLVLAAASGLYWYFTDSNVAWNAFTAVLIVACPCALSLSMPFTMSVTMGIFGRNKFFVKNPDVIQHLATITHIVFDKTGTITQNQKEGIVFSGQPLSNAEQSMVKSLTAHSMHPLSRKIFESMDNVPIQAPNTMHESDGHGIEGFVNGKMVQIGSESFVGIANLSKHKDNASRVFLTIDNVYKGFFSIQNHYRNGLQGLLNRLKKHYKLSLISGDNDAERVNLKTYFGSDEQLLFRMNPTEKLAYIHSLQAQGANVLMIGDGLNDAGALRQSDVGIALTEDVKAFSPACDVILDATEFSRLYDFIRFSRVSVNIVKVSFLVSMIYNAIGLSFAVSGHLSPVFAAILMPVSSLSVVLFAVGVTRWYAKLRGL